MRRIVVPVRWDLSALNGRVGAVCYCKEGMECNARWHRRLCPLCLSCTPRRGVNIRPGLGSLLAGKAYLAGTGN